MRKRPSGSGGVPGWVWGIGGAVVALAVAVPLLRQERADPGPPPAAPAPAAEPPLVVDRDVKPENVTPAEPTLEERRSRYVDARSRELVYEKLAGLPSSSVSADMLAATRRIAEETAGREWDALVILTGGAEALGQRHGEPEVYRAAADLCWPVVRDLARYDEVDVETVKRLLEDAADRARLERRVNGGR